VRFRQRARGRGVRPGVRRHRAPLGKPLLLRMSLSVDNSAEARSGPCSSACRAAASGAGIGRTHRVRLLYPERSSKPGLDDTLTVPGRDVLHQDLRISIPPRRPVPRCASSRSHPPSSAAVAFAWLRAPCASRVRRLRWTSSESARAGLLLLDEAVGKRSGGVDTDNGDDELVPAIALRRGAEG
jgi:hypothetical protein